MRFRWSCHIVFGLFFLLQLSSAGSRKTDEELLLLQLKVENLIEKIINYIQDYYYVVKEELKCIPECVTTTLMETLKKSIDCVEKSQMNLRNGRTTGRKHSKNFLNCFSDAKAEIRETMNSINTSLDYCTDTITEKTYQINVSTTFTKTFNINIKNGLEITKKEIELQRDEKHCFDHRTMLNDVYFDSEDTESSEQAPDDSRETKTTCNPEEEVESETENEGKVTEESGSSEIEGEYDEDEYGEDEFELGTRIMKKVDVGESEIDTKNVEKVTDEKLDVDTRNMKNVADNGEMDTRNMENVADNGEMDTRNMENGADNGESNAPHFVYTGQTN